MAIFIVFNASLLLKSACYYYTRLMGRQQTIHSNQGKRTTCQQSSTYGWIAIYYLLSTVYCLLSTTSYGADWRQCLEEGDKLYAHRTHEGEEWGSLEGAIKKYEEALAGVPKAEKEVLYGLYLRLARTNYQFAYYFLVEEDRVLQGYKNGFEYADKAIKVNDKGGEAYFWRGISAGSFRDKKRLSGVGGLFGGGIKKDLQRVLELDERCVYGGPHRFMAKFHLATDETEGAYVHALRAVEIAPDFLHNQLVLAEALWKLEQKAQAIERLEYIMSKGPGILPEAVIENREVVTRTGPILQDIRDRKEPNWD
jgi:tetratricopeptide (TPR) repeat protein